MDLEEVAMAIGSAPQWVLSRLNNVISFPYEVGPEGPLAGRADTKANFFPFCKADEFLWLLPHAWALTSFY